MMQAQLDAAQANLVAKLETLRKIEGRTVSGMARDLGISRVMYNLVVRGEKPFGPKMAVGVAAKYPYLRDEAFAFVGRKAA